MITIYDKHNCCGCGACEQRCPKGCIKMCEDEEGFLYPKLNSDDCINCGICEKVCPVNNTNEPNEPIHVFAAKNSNDDQRLKSSSGGVFILLAEYVIKQGGVVFGARFNKNWDVEHTYAETVEELYPIMRSKYVQSRIGNSYNLAEQFLREGRLVLFVGTGCQIAGLRKFLDCQYEKLLLVEIVCHGVPSPRVWRKYLSDEIRGSITSINDINFRDKDGYCWEKYGFSIDINNTKYTKPSWETSFIVGFWNNVFLRPACSSCPTKAGKSGSDIIIGDFWGIDKVLPEMNDSKGTSMILVNTLKGVQIVNKLDFEKKVVDYKKAIRYNDCVIKSSNHHINREKFFYLFNRTDKRLQQLLDEAFKLNIFQRLQLKCTKILMRIMYGVKR